MQDGRLTSVRLTELFLERVETYDRSGPRLNAVLEVNPQAREIAETLDRERASGGIRGPLHGIPIFLKDNIATADRLHTSAGSLALKDCIAPRDAFLATRLREAGAVILGKANMTEWANFMTTGMPAGYSSRGGQVKNPYGESLSPGGSSSGSAVAVAAGLCTVAVGTETSGSILSPANWNSVVGVKPTLGLVSRPGIVPIAARQDTARPQEMLRFGQVLLLAAQATSGLRTPTYRRSRAEDLRMSRADGIDQVMKRERLDALVFPGWSGAAIGAKAGYPSVIVAAGYTAEGTPIGLTFLGRAWSEPTLLRLAHAFETATSLRRPPPSVAPGPARPPL